MVPLLLYFRRFLCSFLSSRITAAVQYLKTRSYMHVEASDPAPYHLRIHSSVLPISSQFRSELIALAWRCITRCVHFPFVLCSLRAPVCTWPFRSYPHS